MLTNMNVIESMIKTLMTGILPATLVIQLNITRETNAGINVGSHTSSNGTNCFSEVVFAVIVLSPCSGNDN